MAAILVYLNGSDGELSKASLSAVQAARELVSRGDASDIHGVVLGEHAKSLAEASARFGITKCFFSENEALQKPRAALYALCVKQAVESSGASRIVIPATSMGKDFAPRLAVQLEAGQASEIIGINGDGSYRRPVYAGNALADVEVQTDIHVLTVRATGFDPALESQTSGTALELSFPEVPSYVGEVLGVEIPELERPELSDAPIVVSGGRALKSEEQFQSVLFPLADKLKAAVGASRAAVDSGYAPNDWQVGQTGKVVAPNLYFAIGISGAIQHLAGMKDSKVIVAINKDPDAPIFEVADFGLVADLFEVVPELTEKLS